MRLGTVAWAAAAAVVVGAGLAWVGADVANARDMADLPDDAADLPDGREGATHLPCPALADLDPAYVDRTVDELEERVRAASPLPPSMAEAHVSGIDGAVAAYRPDRRECMRKAMLIHTLASLEQLARPGGTHWYNAHPSEGLKGHFLSGSLTRNLSPQQREDVVAFVEAKVIPALKSDGEADREHWRRMYYGGLLSCHADDELLDQLGGRRSEGCLDVDAIAEASQTMRETTGVIDPWTDPPPSSTGHPDPLRGRR